MGLTIHYCGHLRSYHEIEDLICDVIDICVEIGWRVMPIHPSNIMPAKGLIVTPEASESIWLTFLPDGMLYDAAHFIYTSHPENERIDKHLGGWIATKTRYAGLDTHMAIIKMFRYLSERYFKSFEMRDESSYWETNDISACAVHFGITEKEFIQTSMLQTEDEEDSVAGRMDILVLKRGGLGLGMN